ETELTHCSRGRIQLRYTTIDHDQIGQWLSFIEQSPVASQHHFMHRRNVIRTFNASDSELAILRSIHLPVVANNHAGDILGALDVGNLKRLDSRGEMRQLESFL